MRRSVSRRSERPLDAARRTPLSRTAIVLLALVSGCSGDAASTSESTSESTCAPERPEPSRATERNSEGASALPAGTSTPEGCALAPPEPLGDLGEVRALAAVFEEGGGWIAAARAGSVTFAALGSDGSVGERAGSSDRRVAGLLGAARLRDGDVLMVDARCDGERCGLAVPLDGITPRWSASARFALPGELRTQRRATSPTGALIAWSAEGGRAGATVIRFATPERLEARALELATPADPELPTEVLGAVADERAFAIVWRRGATEDPRARVLVSTVDGAPPVSVEALREALVVESAHLHDGALWLVAGFELSRPHALRLELGEGEPRFATELAAGAPAPAPIAAHARGRLDAEPDGLWLHRATAAGDRVGSPLQVHAGPVRAAALARRGADYLAAWVTDAGAGSARLIRCASP